MGRPLPFQANIHLLNRNFLWSIEISPSFLLHELTHDSYNIGNVGDRKRQRCGFVNSFSSSYVHYKLVFSWVSDRSSSSFYWKRSEWFFMAVTWLRTRKSWKAYLICKVEIGVSVRESSPLKETIPFQSESSSRWAERDVEDGVGEESSTVWGRKAGK